MSWGVSVQFFRNRLLLVMRVSKAWVYAVSAIGLSGVKSSRWDGWIALWLLRHQLFPDPPHLGRIPVPWKMCSPLAADEWSSWTGSGRTAKTPVCWHDLLCWITKHTKHFSESTSLIAWFLLRHNTEYYYWSTKQQRNYMPLDNL